MMDELYSASNKLLNNVDIRNKNKRLSMNETGVETVSLEVMETAKLVYDNLNKILSIIDETSLYYDCESGVNFRNKFYSLSNDFSTIVQNIENYAYSLKNVISRYKENQNIVVTKISDHAEQVREEILRKGEIN